MHPTDRYSKANSIYIFTPPLQETYLPEPPTPDPRLGPAKFVWPAALEEWEFGKRLRRLVDSSITIAYLLRFKLR